MTAIRSIDRSRQVNLIMRKGDTFKWVIAVANPDASPYVFTDHTATCKVYSGPQDVLENYSFVVTLSEGQILVEMTAANSAKIRRAPWIYFLKIVNSEGIFTWLNGVLTVNEGTFDGVVQTSSIVINPQGTALTLTIEGSGGSVVTPDASETVKGIAEIATQAESEDAATNTVVGNIDHTRIVSGRGIRWFWNKVKTIAQSITFEWIFKYFRLLNNEFILQQIAKIDTTQYTYYEELFGIIGDLLPSNDVMAIVESDTEVGVLWHATDGGGLLKVDFINTVSTLFNSTSGNYTGDLLIDSVISPVVSNGELFYRASNALGFFGFVRFNTTTGVVTRYTPTSGNYLGDLIPAGYIPTMLWADGNIIWMTNSGDGLLKYNISTNTITIYNANSGNYTGDILPTILTRRAVVIGDNVWITHLNGLFRFNKVTSVMTKFSTTSGNYTGNIMASNSSQYLVAIGTDLYVGFTSPTIGLFKFDTVNLVLTNFTNSSNNYTGDVLNGSITTFMFNHTGKLIFNQANNTWGIFDVSALHYINKDVILNYTDTMTSLIAFYNDVNENLFPATVLFASKADNSPGLILIDTLPSDIELLYNEDGLRYVIDPENKFHDLSVPTKKYVDKGKLRSFTVAGVPSAAGEGAGTLIFITNEVGGSVPAFSDGISWRRVTDRTVIS